MRKREWIGPLTAIMVVGACAATPPGAPAGDSATAPVGAEWATADPDSKSVRDWSDSGEIPHFYLRSARMRFFGNLVAKDQDKARNNLRLLVLDKSPRFVAENRAYMVREGWQREFIEEFDNIVDWRRRLGEDDGIQAYDQGLEFLSKGGTKSDQYFGKRLLFLAGSLGHRRALFNYARIHFDGDTESDRSTGRYWLRKVADSDFIPAQVEIAERYLEGRGFKTDKAKAIYWLGRAAMTDVTVEPRLRAAHKAASAEEIVEVFTWFWTNITPPE